MKYLLNKKKLVLVLVGLIACFLVACEKKEDEKLENNQDIAPQVVIDDETTDEVNQESEKAEEIENDEEVVDPVMENIAIKYLQAIDKHKHTESSTQKEFNHYSLVNISSSGYPQLVMERYDEENYSGLIRLFSVNQAGELVDMGEWDYISNYSRGAGYYENKNIVQLDWSGGGLPLYYQELYYMSDEGLDLLWGYGCDENVAIIEEKDNGGLDVIGGCYTYSKDDNAENGYSTSEPNKSFEECIEEYKKIVGDDECISFETMDYMTKDEMIKYLNTFLSKASLGKIEAAYAPQIEEIQSPEARKIYRTLIDNIFAGEELIQGTSDGFYYGDNFYNYNVTLEFALIDITGDGTPEFFLNVKEGDSNSWCVYTIKNGDYKKADLGEFGRIHGYMPDTNSIYVSSWACGDDQIYKVNDGRIEIDYSFTCDYDDNLEPTQYYREDSNGITPITMDEYDNAIAELEGYQIVGLELNEENINKYFN